MKKIILAAIIAAAALVSVQARAQTITEDEYRTEVLNLFAEFMTLKSQGVFSSGGTYFGNGGPGGAWLQKAKALEKTGVNAGHGFACFNIPPSPSGIGVCTYDLMPLTNIIDGNAVSFVDALAAKFWLATICATSPKACEEFILN